MSSVRRFLAPAAGCALLAAGCASVGTELSGSAPPPPLPAPEPQQPEPDTRQAPTNWGQGNARSNTIAVADIVGFQLLLNQVDRHLYSGDDFDSDGSSISHNLGHGWVIDRDPFAVNQFGHPYQGTLYHGFARSTGHGYWESLGFDFVASALWEIAGETTQPSLNDQITTSFGGSFLGEALFRMAQSLLEAGGEHPSAFRSFVAALISPATAFNRAAFGKRFDGVYPLHEPATFLRLDLGARQNAKLGESGIDGDLSKYVAASDVVFDYGLPGVDGYRYERPFDYFHFEATFVSSENSLPEDVMTRGLLQGADYAWGEDYRGIWGLYGGYDYISPEVFSVSSTSLSLGTTGQWQATDEIAVQESVLGGFGWTAAGALADEIADRNYHYGTTPQALIALRLVFGDRALFEISGRDYWIGALTGSGGAETVLRSKAALVVRVYGHHAVGVQVVASRRDASYGDVPDTLQSIGAFSIFYSYVSDTKLGAVDW